MPVIETNCLPFTRGRFAFMHNGRLAAFQRVRRKLISTLTDPTFDAIRGSTDSEHIFAVFLDRMAEATGKISAQEIAKAITDTIAAVTQIADSTDDGAASYLNLAVSDGSCAVVTRCVTTPNAQPESLYVQVGERYACKQGRCHMISSEKLSDDAGWESVPANHMVVVDSTRDVHVAPCG